MITIFLISIVYKKVIQKLIERVAPERLVFVQAFRGNVYELSTHPYGCRVLQRCFEHLKEEQTRPLLDELHKYTINLMQDQFGVCLSLKLSYFLRLIIHIELCCAIRFGEWTRSGPQSDNCQTPWANASDGEA